MRSLALDPSFEHSLLVPACVSELVTATSGRDTDKKNPDENQKVAHEAVVNQTYEPVNIFVVAVGTGC